MSLAPLRLPLSWNEIDDNEFNDNEFDDNEFDDNEFHDNKFDDNECHENVTGRIGERGIQFAKRVQEQEELYQDMLVSIVDFSGESFKLLKSLLDENECDENECDKMKEEVKECIKKELITEVKNINKYWFYKPSDHVIKLLVNKVLINLLYEFKYEYKYEARIERIKKETNADRVSDDRECI
jgi:hypothetical protein